MPPPPSFLPHTFPSLFYSTFLLLLRCLYARFSLRFGLSRAEIIAAECSILWGCPAQRAICCQLRRVCVCVCVSQPVCVCVSKTLPL